MGYAIISHNQRKDNMTQQTLDLIKDLFEMLKLQKEYSEILNKQIVNINAQIETLKKKG
jgi:uncharacterized protein YutD